MLEILILMLEIFVLNPVSLFQCLRTEVFVLIPQIFHLVPEIFIFMTEILAVLSKEVDEILHEIWKKQTFHNKRVARLPNVFFYILETSVCMREK